MLFSSDGRRSWEAGEWMAILPNEGSARFSFRQATAPPGTLFSNQPWPSLP